MHRMGGVSKSVKFSLAGNTEAIAAEKEGALCIFLPAARRIFFFFFVRGGKTSPRLGPQQLPLSLWKTFTLTPYKSSLPTEAQHTGRRWNLPSL